MTAPTMSEMKFYIVVPSGATNYVTNPTPYKATTGYTASGGSIAVTDDESRRGPGCLEVTPTTDSSGVYFGTVSVTDTVTYTYSVDVKGEEGKAMRIVIADTSGNALSLKSFTATGYWERHSITRTENATTTRRLYVLRDATTGTNVFYVDGFQFEQGSEATTFFSGDNEGFDDNDFYWNGTPHASTSTRSASTRAGGQLLDLEDYCIVKSAFGLGLGPFNQVYSELVSGGAIYQRHIRKPRNFSLLVQYYGTSAGALHTNRNTVIEAIRPDYSGYDQPLIVRYQGFDSSDSEATNPIDIVCIPQPSHQDIPDNSRLQNDVLSFTVLDGYLKGAYKEGIELDPYDTLADADYFVMRDEDGLWSVPNNSGTGATGDATVIAEAVNGDIYMGGSFANAGGVAEADNLFKWDGSAITAVTAGIAGPVMALCFDASSNLYIGGYFEDVGDANGDHIVKWSGSALSSLGTGMNEAVRALAIDPSTGYLYAGGDFTAAGGVADTAHIAYWNGSAWVEMATGLNGNVYALAFSPDGKLYIGGAFTSADGSDGDYLCYWNGTAFFRIGTTELSGVVYDVCFDKNGELIAGGAFTNAGGNANADCIARWNGNEWESLGTGLNGDCYSVVVDNDNNVYAAGNFNSAGGIATSDRVAVYSNGAWKSLDIDLAGTDIVWVSYIATDNSLYISGEFTGTAYAADQKTVTNGANTNIYPTIEVTGPGVLQGFSNFTIGKSIQFDGLTLQAGEIIKMQLNPIDLKMTSNWTGRGSVLRYVNAGSDLGDFYLRPGDNSITFFMPSGTSAATKAYIYWTPAFWNIEGALYG